MSVAVLQDMRLYMHFRSKVMLDFKSRPLHEFTREAGVDSWEFHSPRGEHASCQPTTRNVHMISPELADGLQLWVHCFQEAATAACLRSARTWK